MGGNAATSHVRRRHDRPDLGRRSSRGRSELHTTANSRSPRSGSLRVTIHACAVPRCSVTPSRISHTASYSLRETSYERNRSDPDRVMATRPVTRKTAGLAHPGSETRPGDTRYRSVSRYERCDRGYWRVSSRRIDSRIRARPNPLSLGLEAEHDRSRRIGRVHRGQRPASRRQSAQRTTAA